MFASIYIKTDILDDAMDNELIDRYENCLAEYSKIQCPAFFLKEVSGNVSSRKIITGAINEE